MADDRLHAPTPPFLDDGIDETLPVISAERLRAARTEFWQDASLEQRREMIVQWDLEVADRHARSDAQGSE